VWCFFFCLLGGASKTLANAIAEGLILFLAVQSGKLSQTVEK